MTSITPTRVRLKDIAAEAKVSISTASMALADHPAINAETKRRVTFLCRKLGYQRPHERNAWQSRKTQAAKVKRFGFMVIGTPLNDEVLTSLLRQLTDHATQRGFRMEVAAVEKAGDPQALVKRVMGYAQELDGLILQGLVTPQLLKDIEPIHIPCVVTGHVMQRRSDSPIVNGHVLEYDEIAMGRLACARLLDRGHQRIGFICEKLYPGLWSNNWLSGYLLAHRDAGVTHDEDCIAVSDELYAGGEPAAQAYGAMKLPPTAYVIPDVRICASFLAAMNRRGIEVGREAIIMGGDPEVAIKYHLESHPMIGYDSDVMAQAALDRLIQLEQKPPKYPTVLQLPFKMCYLPEPASLGHEVGDVS